MAKEQDALGGARDSVKIEIDDQRVEISQSYEVQISVLRQPGAFTLRIGSAHTVQELLATVIPRKSKYRLFINNVLIQTGLIYGVAVPSAAHTIVEIKGRDNLAPLYDAYVPEDRKYDAKTYVALTRKVMDDVGLTDVNLVTSNETNRLELSGKRLQTTVHKRSTPAAPSSKASEANRDAKLDAITKGDVAARAMIPFGAPVSADEREFQDFIITSMQREQSASAQALVDAAKVAALKTPAAGGESTVCKQTMPAKCGQRYWDLLESNYKLAGLVLFAAANGDLVLTRPNADQPPSTRIIRQRNGGKRTTNIVDCRYQNDTTQRHTRCVVYGRIGKGKRGAKKIRGEFPADDLADAGFDSPIVIHDRDIKSTDQANYIARKTIAEERRTGWQLTYTVSGHTTGKVGSADGASTHWAPDTVTEVDDQELAISGKFYLEQVTFRQGKEGTSTEIVLMRPDDLVFAEGLFEPTPAQARRNAIAAQQRSDAAAALDPTGT